MDYLAEAKEQYHAQLLWVEEQAMIGVTRDANILAAKGVMALSAAMIAMADELRAARFERSKGKVMQTRYTAPDL